VAGEILALGAAEGARESAALCAVQAGTGIFCHPRRHGRRAWLRSAWSPAPPRTARRGLPSHPY